MTKKERLDTILVQKGIYSSKEKAQAAVMAGLVFVEGRRAEKPGEKMNEDIAIETKGEAIPYVSRGGLKLEKALHTFHLSMEKKVCLDVGASTGGFTDCLLKHGAKKVYAVDVGYGQLDWGLRNDSRVVVMERVNVRYIQPADFEDKLDLAVIDVSFISLKKVLEPVFSVLDSAAEAIALIKPQFEVGKKLVGKKGVVKDPEIHRACLEDLAIFFTSIGLVMKNITFSPITGPQGNIEYLAHLVRADTPPWISLDESGSKIQEVVMKAHGTLK